MYKRQPTENSQIIIRRIEPLGDDISVHVSISPVPLRRTSDGKLVGGVIAHLPFEYETLRSALIELEDSTDEESELFLEGYLQWKEAEGGIFTIPPNEAVEYVYQITGATEVIEQ